MTRSYSAAVAAAALAPAVVGAVVVLAVVGVVVVSCKNPITTEIQSRKSRSHRQGVDQSNNMTQVVCVNNDGVNV